MDERNPRGPAPARSRAPAPNVTRVTSPSTTVVTLEIDVQREPISGRLVDENHVVHRFTGWVGLTQVIGAVLLGARRASALPATPPSDTPRSSR